MRRGWVVFLALWLLLGLVVSGVRAYVDQARSAVAAIAQWEAAAVEHRNLSLLEHAYSDGALSTRRRDLQTAGFAHLRILQVQPEDAQLSGFNTVTVIARLQVATQNVVGGSPDHSVFRTLIAQQRYLMSWTPTGCRAHEVDLGDASLLEAASPEALPVLQTPFGQSLSTNGGALFWILPVALRNDSSVPISVMPGDFSLIDSGGRAYFPDRTVMAQLPSTWGPVTVGPGQRDEAALIFIAPSDFHPKRLELSAGGQVYAVLFNLG
jgi:hypothetical protein